MTSLDLRQLSSRLGHAAHLVVQAVQLALQVAALVRLLLQVGQQRHLLVDQLEAGLGLDAVRPVDGGPDDPLPLLRHGVGDGGAGGVAVLLVAGLPANTGVAVLHLPGRLGPDVPLLHLEVVEEGDGAALGSDASPTLPLVQLLGELWIDSLEPETMIE